MYKQSGSLLYMQITWSWSGILSGSVSRNASFRQSNNLRFPVHQKIQIQTHASLTCFENSYSKRCAFHFFHLKANAKERNADWNGKGRVTAYVRMLSAYLSETGACWHFLFGRMVKKSQMENLTRLDRLICFLQLEPPRVQGYWVKLQSGSLFIHSFCTDYWHTSVLCFLEICINIFKVFILG